MKGRTLPAMPMSHPRTSQRSERRPSRSAPPCFPGFPMLRSLCHRLAVAGLLLCAPAAVAGAQLIARAMPAPGPAAAPAAPSAMAVRVAQAPVLDGITNDPAWATARVIEDFREYEPDEGTESRFRTEVR